MKKVRRSNKKIKIDLDRFKIDLNYIESRLKKLNLSDFKSIYLHFFQFEFVFMFKGIKTDLNGF